MDRTGSHERTRDLTQGHITARLLCFALPLMAGNLLQQLYNVADTWVVGRFLGADALAAVGSSYTLMVFVTSILLGLCMGSGADCAVQYGKRDFDRMKTGIFLSFVLIAAVTALLCAAVYLGMDGILWILQVPARIEPLMRSYLVIVFAGIPATFLYNYFANLLRAAGDSATPLWFLAVSAVLNIALDLLFVLVLHWGVQGAAAATVIAQYVSGLGLAWLTWVRFRVLLPRRAHCRWDGQALRTLAGLSGLTSVQQSVMNFGILLVQGRVNSFGPAVMAAFAAAVKIDSFAYMPVQDFGNAFSTFVAQNFGAGKTARIRSGVRSACICAAAFCLAVGGAVFVFARPLMTVFVDPSEIEILTIGVQYLHIESVCYSGIGILFLLYGYFRAVGRPGMSVVLTVISLGTRVALAYTLSAVPQIGVVGIWVSVPIGWALADLAGVLCLRRGRCRLDAKEADTR